MQIELSPIVPPKRFRPKQFQYAIEDALMDEMADIDALFQEIIGTWRNKPTVHQELKASGNDITASIWVDDRRMFFLNEGTSVRHAIMHKSFRRKTRPGQLKSSAGGGRRNPVFISRNVSMNSPSGKKGIVARRWDDIIIKRRRVPYTLRMAKAMGTGAIRSLFG